MTFLPAAIQSLQRRDDCGFVVASFVVVVVVCRSVIVSSVMLAHASRNIKIQEQLKSTAVKNATGSYMMYDESCCFI